MSAFSLTRSVYGNTPNELFARVVPPCIYSEITECYRVPYSVPFSSSKYSSMASACSLEDPAVFFFGGGGTICAGSNLEYPQN